MPDESVGRWAIVQTVGDYHEYQVIRCFFASKEEAEIRWDFYEPFEQERREVRFIGYGEAVSF